LEPLGVPAQHVLRRDLLRVEVSLPLGIRVAAGSDQHAHAHVRGALGIPVLKLFDVSFAVAAHLR
jgi:hypothetical protein